ncbi:Molecular chaperone (DnaJ superfamily) [Phaffia rhodozyma]|uniref:Molecular chaperone (DnaJ superfamily) n=1 Tax=Phaffia rhodozyma TaxID=264483 RepID=A0A0F7SIG1_PHARH|nr:Molecular chaperone (DnaJ superfamily) [Phaffia rhodozyma]
MSLRTVLCSSRCQTVPRLGIPSSIRSFASPITFKDEDFPIDPSSAWEVLHLPEGASCQQVKQAYYRLVRVHHPDCQSTSERLKKHPIPAKERFHYLQTAYETLGNPTSRELYLRTKTGWAYSRAPRLSPSNYYPRSSSTRHNLSQTAQSYHHANFERYAHSMYFDPKSKTQPRGRWNHNPAAEWETTPGFGTNTSGVAPDGIFQGWTKARSARWLVFTIILSMVYGLLPAALPRTDLRSDYVHRLAIQSLQQAREDAMEVGDWKAPMKERLLRMEEEEQERKKTGNQSDLDLRGPAPVAEHQDINVRLETETERDLNACEIHV